jgi:hypothetical protein
MKRKYILGGIFALVIFSVFLFDRVNRRVVVNQKVDTCEISKCLEKVEYKNASANLVQVELPFPNAVVGKEFSVIGKARGVWYFEASFPVVLLDSNGRILSETHADAQSDWMTENFVPFRANIKVPESYIGPARLILKKDNPSGLTEHDASISFDIVIEY